MCRSIRCFLIVVCCCTVAIGFVLTNTSGIYEAEEVDFYKDILIEMHKQQPYDGLLIVQHARVQYLPLAAIYTLETPKIILTNPKGFYHEYKTMFDSDIMAVIIMEYHFQTDLWNLLVEQLNYMRQTRILMILLNVFNVAKLKRKILIECEKSKITNIILHFPHTSTLSEKLAKEYFLLAPYPEYQLHLQQFGAEVKEYFRTNKLDMKGKAIVTLPDQSIPRSLMYRDENDQLHFSGFAFRMVELFTQMYNATYKLLYRPQLDKVIHLSILANMTRHGLLDMPMSVSPIHSSSKLLYLSYPVECSKWIIMFPCAERMKINQVYEVLLPVDLFFVFLVFSIVFSLVHTVIEKLFYNKFVWLNLLMSDKVVPGLMGQSYNLKKTKLMSLRWIYIFIFVLGLYMSTTISAHLQTLLTSPPYYRQIKTFEDLRLRGVKIFFDRLDMRYLGADDDLFKDEIEKVIEFTDNTTMFNRYRQTFNSTYAYPVTWALWNVFTSIQVYYAEKAFCANDDLNVRDTLLLGMPLETNSPYRQPMDDLIHQIHASGLVTIWQIDVINKLLMLHKISFRDESRIKMFDDLTENDLLYVWAILLSGLAASVLVFVCEIIIYFCLMYFRIKFGKIRE